MRAGNDEGSKERIGLEGRKTNEVDRRVSNGCRRLDWRVKNKGFINGYS